MQKLEGSLVENSRGMHAERSRSIPELRFSEYGGKWERIKLGKITLLITGATPSTMNGDYWGGTIRWMNSGELNLKRVYEVENRITEKGLKHSSTKLIPKHSVLIGLAGQGKTRGTVAMNMVELCTNQSIAAILPAENIYNSDFLYHNLDGRYDELRKLSTGEGGRGGLNLQILKSLPINLPTLPEQQKIANFFTAIDQKISQLKRKKTLLEQYKKGVMQKIFSQQIRFKPALSEVEGDDGKEFPDWELRRLGEVFQEFRKASTLNNQYEVLTSSNKGLLLQKDYYGDNRITERENKGFNVIPEGFITYRSRSDNGIFTFNMNNLGLTGVISTYYPVFTAIDGDNKFFVEFLNYHWKIISVFSVGTSQKVFPFTAFNQTILGIPSKEEQTKIANFLSAIDNKIQHTQKQIERAEQWKKGLMQKMFV